LRNIEFNLDLGRVNAISCKPRLYFINYGQPLSIVDPQRFVFVPSTSIRSFHSSPILFDDKSKIEKTVDLLKDKPEQTTPKPPIASTDTAVPTTTTTEKAVVKRKSLWERIVHELKHYYNGFKLLFIETKIAFRLLRQVLNGHTLTRRERRQVSHSHGQTTSSFSVFSI